MIRVFVADDHPIVRQGLTRMLGAETDMTIVGTCGDGESAIAAIEKGGFEVLVLDLSMPGLGGLDVVPKARALRPGLKILVFTMHAEVNYALRVLRAGADGFLSKESAPDAILTAIRTIAKGQRYIPAAAAGVLLESPTAEVAHDSLSEREMAILVAVGRGQTPSEIAGALSLAPSTVSSHIARIRGKLDARSLGDLVRYAIKAGLVE